MNTKANYRMERIGRLLEELEYEVSRGIIENEIDENILFKFTIPVSRVLTSGVVYCEFRTMPVTSYMLEGGVNRLKIVK